MEFAGPSGPVATAALHGSPFPSGRPLYKFEGDPYEFQYKTGFSTMDEMVQFLPPETYSFKWTTVSGSTLNEPLDLPAFEPLEPRKLINYDALQNIKPQQPVVIQWEPMSGLDGKDGFIEVEIIYTDEWSHFLWSSEDLVEEGFGLDPTTTSVEVPAGTFIGSPDGRYQILISFARIEYLVANDTNPAGLKGVATTTMTRATLKTQPEVPGHIILPAGDWLYCELLGAVFGCTMEWGYSNELGWVFLGYTP
ncbi:MAG TPA: hypothetical protein VK995_03470, partial [Oceanipulchritudo sp.]|nr:hypothetical protein [Oceanipulchritudo sp.]